jgi:Tfp pilus assembly protein PilN
MINLLPPESKTQLRFARLNTTMVRWAVLMAAVIVGLAGIVAFGDLYIRSSIKNYQAQNQAAEAQLKLQKVDQIQGQVKTFSDNMKLVIQVLSKEVLFSQLIKQVGAAMPPNTILDGLQISQVQGGLDFSARAKDYDAATQVQVNMQDPDNKIFAKADILNITCQDTSQLQASAAKGSSVNLIDLNYPCTVNVRGLFSNDNPFLFIHKAATPAKAAP